MSKAFEIKVPTILKFVVEKLSSPDEIKEGCRLFYELGEYTKLKDGIWDKNSWVRSGEFIEVESPIEFRDAEYSRLTNPEWVEHHNFCIIKP